MEAEIKAARERAIVPLEARMKQFKDMLLERGVRNCYIPLLCWWLLIIMRNPMLCSGLNNELGLRRPGSLISHGDPLVVWNW